MLDHMIVGEDITVGADDESRAETLLSILTPGGITEKPLEELVSEITVERSAAAEGGAEAAALEYLGGGDVDHGRFYLFRKIGKGTGHPATVTGRNGRAALRPRPWERNHAPRQTPEKADQTGQQNMKKVFDFFFKLVSHSCQELLDDCVCCAAPITLPMNSMLI